jgi:hypothetical protein
MPFLAVSHALWQRLDTGEYGAAFAPYAEPGEKRMNAVRAAIGLIVSRAVNILS